MMKIEDLTLGEIEEIELLVGRSIEEAFATGKPKGRALRAFMFIANRRDNPNYKFEETENISQAEALKLLTGDDPKEQ